MIQDHVTFPNEHEQELSGFIRIPDEDGKYPVVIVCHGFMQTKDRELYMDIANLLSYQQFITLRFDFLHHGESHGETVQASLTQMIEDIKDAIDFIEKIPQADKDRIAIIGHDLGGMAALLLKDPRVKALCTIASRTSTTTFMNSYFDEYEIKEWKRDLYYDCQEIRLGIAFLNDIYKHDVLEAAGSKHIPMLFINGTNDKRTPFDEAKRLFYHSKVRQLEIVDGADHNFTEKEHRMGIIDVINNWLKQNV